MDIQIWFPHRFVEGRVEGDGFFFTCRHQFIDLIQVNYTKLFKFSVISINLISETRITHQGLVLKERRFSVVYISVDPRGTKAHWINPFKCFCGILDFMNWIQVHISNFLRLVFVFRNPSDKSSYTWFFVSLLREVR